MNRESRPTSPELMPPEKLIVLDRGWVQTNANSVLVMARHTLQPQETMRRAPEVSKPVIPVAAEEPKPVPEPPVQSAPALAEYDGPPRTRRDAAYETLSRVDSNERAQADREFASFDHQSPFVDQPAFVPTDTPTTDHFPEPTMAPPATEPQTMKQMENPMNGHQKTGGSPPSEIEIPVQDRWAQIRRTPGRL